MPSHMVHRTSVSEKWRPERDRRGGGGGGRGLTLIQVGKRKEVKKESMQRGGKGRRESDKTSAGEDHPLYRTVEVRDYSASGSDLQVCTFTVSVVTEACINNVAERNRMQILPYIRVYRGLAASEQPLSFSASPSGWMHTRFPELINHHICHPNNFSRWVCCNKGMRAELKPFLTSVYWL